MRNDLPSLGAGRAAAQASHASNAFIHKFGNVDTVRRWQAQTPQGFGTAIVLSASKKEIGDTLTECSNTGVTECDEIIDPDYVIPISSEIIPYIDTHVLNMFEPSKTDSGKYFFHRTEITCAYVFGYKEKLSSLLSKFPLYS